MNHENYVVCGLDHYWSAEKAKWVSDPLVASVYGKLENAIGTATKLLGDVGNPVLFVRRWYNGTADQEQWWEVDKNGLITKCESFL